MDYDFAVKNFKADSNGVITGVGGRRVNVNARNGYLYVSVGDKCIPVHRLVYWLLVGFTDMEIDHIDRNKINNKIENLRVCSRGQNCRNVGVPVNNTSGFKGVTWNKKADKWQSQIKFNGKKIYLGLFTCKIEAAKAYDDKCVELHGEFALTNKMMSLY